MNKTVMTPQVHEFCGRRKASRHQAQSSDTAAPFVESPMLRSAT